MDRLRVVASRLACVLAVLFVVSCSSQATVPPPERSSESIGETSQAVVTALTLYATGVDNANVQLAIGTVDPHYKITASGDGAHPGPNAIVSAHHPAWVAAAAPSQWLSLDSSECATCASADFDYSMTFTMPAGANPLTATFTATLASDDDLDILVNGTVVLLGGGTIGFNTTTNRTVGPNVAAFTSGTNTVTFRVHNSGGSYTGLLVQSISGTASDCTADAMCSAVQFCDTGATSCTAKLANGVAIPTIASHTPPLTGVCSAAVGTAVCSSGACGTSSNKCTPAVNGCASDGDCTAGNFCNGTTFTCTAKIANGASLATPDALHNNGTCSVAIGTIECVSGACGTVSNKCVPASNGCASDGDCGAGKFCNGTTLTCAAKLANGSTLVTPDALHNNGVCSVAVGTAECTSGACATGSNKCVPAGGCAADNDCLSTQFCNGSTFACVNKLANGGSLVNPDTLHNNGTCSVAVGLAECTSGACATGSNKCTPAVNGCAADGDCAAGFFCNGTTFTCTGKLANGLVLVNPDALHNNGTCSPSVGAAECVSGACAVGSNTCTPAGGCGADSDCASGQFCNGSTLLCVSKLVNGTQLVTPDTFHNNGVCSVAVGTAECASGACASSSNKCVPAGGSGCAADTDCTAGQFCNGSTLLCVAKLANSAALVNPDTLHNNGTCSLAVGIAECTGAVCDTDNKCGYANGDGTCTAGTAAAVCRSATCGAISHVCVPSGGTGCLVDGDCSAAQFCNGSTLTCTAKLANGAPLVNDVPHNGGICNPSVGTAECASGVCDADNKCGYANNDGTCSSGNTTVCRSGACGSDLKCGLAVGDGTCNAGNGATVCRSGVCGAASGKCVPSGGAGCEVDGDCSAAQFCNGSTLTCTAKLANGASLTTPDPLHGDGVCSGAVGTAECAGGVCDSDNKCGLANGDGTCTSGNGGTVCRSGACGASSGKCIPSGGGGCATDADCSSGQFCNGSTLACVGKLANGVALVTPDTLHNNGTCTAPVGTAECLAGFCDADNKCGFANGDGSCTSGTATTVCRSGACGSDTKCGLLNGDGTCTTGNAGTVCRSGACGASSGLCVPTGGCAVDADCGSGRYCNTPTKTCVATLANGVAIPTVTGHTPTLNGVCSQAAATAVCTSGVCDTTANVCGINSGDGTCTATSQCNSGVCVTSGTNSGKCEPCVADTTCSGGTPACNTTTNQCVPCTATNGTACTGPTPSCVSNACVACNGDNGSSTTAACPTATNPYCAAGGTCGKCTTNVDCTGAHAGPICNTTTGACGALCTTDSDCSATQWCDNATSLPAAGTCAAKIPNGQSVPAGAPIGGTCTAAVGTRVCVSGACDTGDNLCGEPNSRACTAAATCRSGVCNTDQKCGDPNGTACTAATTCRSGLCDGDNKCGERNGETCANDVDCRSGLCQPADHTCGALNGEACTSANASVCRSGVCFTDNACGLPIGQTCTVDTTCRNGACIAGKCTASCTADAQCLAHSYCDATSKSCLPDAANGAKPGGAACTRGAQCSSGVCNADGTCGDPDGATCTSGATCRGGSCVAGACGAAIANGAACTSGAQCASNVCALDGLCGALTGGPCANATQCRSAACDITGTCVLACSADTDCTADAYCSASACLPRAAVGAKPGGANCTRGAQCTSDVCDGDGVCGSINGETCGSPLTCRAAICDNTDGKCGSANGDGPCTVADEGTVCRSGICDPSDLKCGYANGDGPCSSGTTCRSNTCDSTGTKKCVGCLKDSDCSTGNFCNATTSLCGPTLSNGSSCTRPTQCTSAVCDSDGSCGKKDGEPCTVATECRSAACTAGACGAGKPDAGAPDGGAVDSGVDAAAPDGGSVVDAGHGVDASTPSSDASTPADATVADGGRNDIGDQISGGGCACDIGSSSSSPWAAFGALAAVAALASRRTRRRSSRDAR